MRLNKFIAHAGICSRRKAADLVKAGKIKVNGEVEINPAVIVEENDCVEYKGKLLKAKQDYVYFLLNKPKNRITTLEDPQGRPTVKDIFKKYTTKRVFPVGRLDRNTTGLLLFTNDGDLAQKLSHPSYEIEKVYEVFLDKEIRQEDLEKIRAGFELEDGPVAVDAINYVQGESERCVSINLHIGRNRIVRRIFEHFGYHVVKLDRTVYAGLTKKGIGRGFARPLEKHEIRRLKHFI